MRLIGIVPGPEAASGPPMDKCDHCGIQTNLSVGVSLPFNGRRSLSLLFHPSAPLPHPLLTSPPLFNILNTQRCSRCKVVKYCSKACQKINWAKHRVSCIGPTPPPSFNLPAADDTMPISISDKAIEEHRLFMESLGAHAVSKGYMPDMGAMQQYQTCTK